MSTLSIKKIGLVICMLSGLFVAQWTHAASFDCAKASSKVEHMICDTPAISKLDEELAKSYKAALQDKAKAEQVKQAQKLWLKERNGCADAACVKLSYETRQAMLAGKTGAASSTQTEHAEQFPQIPTKLRYAFCDKNKPELYCEGQTGKGYTVCEAYLKHLQTLTSPPTCEAPIPPGFSLPDWEEMDVTQHLDLAYQAEGLFLKKFGGYKHPDFEAWKTTFLQEIKEGKISPRMRKAKVVLNDKGEAVILAYTRDKEACHKVYGTEEQLDAKTGRRIGRPSHPYWSSQGNAGQLWASEQGDVHFILPRDTPNTLQVIVGWPVEISRMKSDMLIYSGRPYFVVISRQYRALYRSIEERDRMMAGQVKKGLIDGKPIVWMDNSSIGIIAFDPRFPDTRPNLDLNHYSTDTRCQLLPY